jgi:uncharacterized protein (TIGR00251 family)
VTDEAQESEGTPLWLAPAGPDVLLAVKAVPGAKRDAIAGPLGARLKIRVAAPPEGGRANAAICALLAAHLGVPLRAVTIERGRASPEKTIRIAGLPAATVAARLAS